MKHRPARRCVSGRAVLFVVTAYIRLFSLFPCVSAPCNKKAPRESQDLLSMPFSRSHQRDKIEHFPLLYPNRYRRIRQRVLNRPQCLRHISLLFLRHPIRRALVARNYPILIRAIHLLPPNVRRRIADLPKADVLPVPRNLQLQQHSSDIAVLPGLIQQTAQRPRAQRLRCRTIRILVRQPCHRLHDTRPRADDDVRARIGNRLR